MKNFIPLLLVSLMLCSCGTSADESWSSAVPTETSFVIVPASNATVDSVMQAAYLPALEDASASAIQLISTIDSTATQSLPVQGILLYPGSENKLQPIWILQHEGDLIDKLQQHYTRKFTQNEYSFDGTPILRLNINNRPLFVSHVSNFLLVSESSNGIENAIRTYSGKRPGMALTGVDVQPGNLIMNTPHLGAWITQFAEVRYHPALKNAFAGTSPALLSPSYRDEGGGQIRLTGSINLGDQNPSTIIQAFSHQPGDITLDEYISSNAAAFGIFYAAPTDDLADTLPDTSAADQEILENPDMLTELGEPLAAELALVMYAESGFLSAGEYLYIRKLGNTDVLQSRLESLNSRGLIEKTEGLYYVQSHAIARLFSSNLSNFSDFYLNITGDAVVMSKRKGLAELVASDRSRRRVVSYEPFFEEIESTLPEQVSGLFVAGPEFNSFISPYLNPGNYLQNLTTGFSYMALATQINETGDNLSFELTTYGNQGENQPYRENWLSNAGGAPLSGPPAFGNIGGSSNDEVIFATENGNVYALAADGTVVQRYNTGRDVPAGSPVVYDWYGTGQNVVLLAAGNKIYGWDENGDTLPKFPWELNEQITTSLTVTDLNNNRIPNAIVGTVDRKIHVLNGRGENLAGWPVTVIAPVRTAPLVNYFQGGPAVIAFSSNAVHAWDASGTPLANFPAFANANLQGAPALIDGSIAGNGVDGNLYIVGTENPVADSVNVYPSGESAANIRAVNVTNSALSGTPFVHENTILTASQDGALFLLNANGTLRLTKSMGQPISQAWSPIITDINGDGQQDMVALANYGRLYAWQLSNGERITTLPTAGIRHLAIGDIDGDGLKELVAQTEKGVQSWTINR